MVSFNESEGDLTVVNNKMVVHTPVLFEHEAVDADILILPSLIDRVTDKVFSEVDGYIPSDTKASAIESWLGRFATDELDENGIFVGGWRTNLNMAVRGSERIDPSRTLPFLVRSDDGSLEVSSPEANPEVVEIERDFTPRAMAFLIEKSIVA